ncbi:MAG: replication factor C large subunit [Methanomassiliicoccales archaeon]
MNDDWTELYRPSNLSEVLGNPKAVKDLRDWAIAWEAGSPTEKAVVLMGPPGIGKTSTALALAKEFNWGVVEMNASDQRNADAIKNIAIRGATSDTFTDSGEFLSAKDGRRKLIILDEADNIFGREDHGGIPAMAELIRMTKQPVILIVNDFYELGRRSSIIKTGTRQVKFTKLQSATVRSILKRIAADQRVEVDESVIYAIADRSNGDMRAAIRDLQAVAQGMEHVRMDDMKGLGDRLSKRSMYDLMGDILQGTSGAKARSTMMDADEDIDYMMKWLDENIPLVYKDPEELFRAYAHMSRADLYLSRVSNRQYYGFWSYAGEMMTYGVCTSKSSVRRGYVQYNFPKMLLRLSRTKDARGVKARVALKLGSECHSSMKQVVEDILPYFRELYQKDNDFRISLSSRMSWSRRRWPISWTARSIPRQSSMSCRRSRGREGIPTRKRPQGSTHPSPRRGVRRPRKSLCKRSQTSPRPSSSARPRRRSRKKIGKSPRSRNRRAPRPHCSDHRAVEDEGRPEGHTGEATVQDGRRARGRQALPLDEGVDAAREDVL